jgi:RimJ/RimL family protein N-acetyltransferase
VKPLHTPRLVIRNWEDRDRALFHRINSDERVMEFYPFRRNRQQADEVMNQLRAAIDARGFGLAALELARSGETIGYVGLSPVTMPPVIPKEEIEIGWRLAAEHWGQGYASEAASALLRFGFRDLDLEEIISFAVATNLRSIAVMQRIGLRYDENSDFDHPRVPETQPHLRQHVLYRLSREDWRER